VLLRIRVLQDVTLGHWVSGYRRYWWKLCLQNVRKHQSSDTASHPGTPASLLQFLGSLSRCQITNPFVTLKTCTLPRQCPISHLHVKSGTKSFNFMFYQCCAHKRPRFRVFPRLCQGQITNLHTQIVLQIVRTRSITSFQLSPAFLKHC
jgi:hypothetical protein